MSSVHRELCEGGDSIGLSVPGWEGALRWGAVLPGGLSGDLGSISGNLEVWVTRQGMACLVGVSSAVIQGTVMDTVICHLCVSSEHTQTTLSRPQRGHLFQPFAHPEPSPWMDSGAHLPMRLFNSFTSSCLRISSIRGHTWATNTEKRVRPGTGKSNWKPWDFHK